MFADSRVVLFVDGHQDSVALYALSLLATGFQPVVARNAEEGFARACSVHPDVIVTAAVLDDASGLDLTRRLRRDQRTRHACIILLTAQATEAVEREAKAAGCDRLLAKPCVPYLLTSEIGDALARRLKRTVQSPS
jgi:CheY-like chemotaxis protein